LNVGIVGMPTCVLLDQRLLPILVLEVAALQVLPELLRILRVGILTGTLGHVELVLLFLTTHHQRVELVAAELVTLLLLGAVIGHRAWRQPLVGQFRVERCGLELLLRAQPLQQPLLDTLARCIPYPRRDVTAHAR
jgi:hypothetical protein